MMPNRSNLKQFQVSGMRMKEKIVKKSKDTFFLPRELY